MDTPLLYPAPRFLTLKGETLDLSRPGVVLLPPRPEASAQLVAQMLIDLLDPDRLGRWKLRAGTARTTDPVVSLDVQPGTTGHAEGYTLDVDSAGVRIVGDDAAGLFYGVQTFRQLLVRGPVIPQLNVVDFPALRRRGVMLDVSRDRVQTMETLYRLVDELSSWKYNELQLYVEHTFAYAGHEAVWGGASPLTGHEILQLDQYCRDRFVELVPNQNALGHLHKWLEKPSYSHLAENFPYADLEIAELVTHRGQPFWGRVPYSICPTDPEAVDLVLGLFDELLPYFSSTTVNVGLDEPFDLALGRSRDAASAVGGRQQVYLDHLRRLHGQLSSQGYTVQLWGDFVAEHPESIEDVPEDVVVVDWGYWESYPFGQRAESLATSGHRFYLATGTNAWCSIGGRWQSTQAHMRAATDAALRHGAEGILVTDWGWFDYGTYQQHPVSYVGFLFGAGELWSPVESRPVPFAQALSTHALGDPSGLLGALMVELAEICPGGGPRIVDTSPLYWALREDVGWVAENTTLTPEQLTDAHRQCAAIEARLGSATSSRDDGHLLLEELRLTVRLLRHGIGRTIIATSPDPVERDRLRAVLSDDLPGLLGAFGHTWLQRYRLGGLAGTTGRLAEMESDYTPEAGHGSAV